MAFFTTFAPSRGVPAPASDQTIPPLDKAAEALQEAILDTFSGYKIVDYKDKAKKVVHRINLPVIKELASVIRTLNAQERSFNLSQRLEILHLKLLEQIEPTRKRVRKSDPKPEKIYILDQVVQGSVRRFLRQSNSEKHAEKLVKKSLKLRIALLPEIEKFIRTNQKKIDAINIDTLEKNGSSFVTRIIKGLVELNKRLQHSHEVRVHDVKKTPFESVIDDSML